MAFDSPLRVSTNRYFVKLYFLKFVLWIDNLFIKYTHSLEHTNILPLATIFLITYYL